MWRTPPGVIAFHCLKAAKSRASGFHSHNLSARGPRPAGRAVPVQRNTLHRRLRSPRPAGTLSRCPDPRAAAMTAFLPHEDPYPRLRQRRLDRARKRTSSATPTSPRSPSSAASRPASGSPSAGSSRPPGTSASSSATACCSKATRGPPSGWRRTTRCSPASCAAGPGTSRRPCGTSCSRPWCSARATSTPAGRRRSRSTPPCSGPSACRRSRPTWTTTAPSPGSASPAPTRSCSNG